MTKNSLINALTAGIYIVVISLIMYVGTKYFPKGPSVLIPVAMISLFTLSAAIMGYIFCYQPLQLYFANKKKEAVNLFLQTVGIFAIVTLIFFVVLFTGIIKY